MLKCQSLNAFSLDEPLLITVCKDNQYNYTRASSTGYTFAKYYLSGQTVNQSVLSWIGPVAGNRSVWDTVRFLYRATKDTNFNMYPKLSGNLTGNYTERFLIPYGLCQAFEGRVPGYMAISLPDTHIFAYNVHITDPVATTTFQLPYSLLSGDKISIKPSTLTSYTNFKIKITQDSLETDDGTCTDYPNDGHQSYSDCIDAEIRNKILPSLGCMVPWMSDVDACSQPIPRLAKHGHILNWLLNITIKAFGNIEYRSDTCLPPCNRMSFQARLASSGSLSYAGDNRLFLNFMETVEIRRIVLSYDATSLLVEVGSCLGLWLGLSVVGMFDVCTLMLVKLVRGLLSGHKKWTQ